MAASHGVLREKELPHAVWMERCLNGEVVGCYVHILSLTHPERDRSKKPESSP